MHRRQRQINRPGQRPQRVLGRQQTPRTPPTDRQMLLRQPTDRDPAPLLIPTGTTRIQGTLAVEPETVTRVRRQPGPHLIGLLRRADAPHLHTRSRVDHTVALPRVPTPSHEHHPHAAPVPAGRAAPAPPPHAHPWHAAPGHAATYATPPPGPNGWGPTPEPPGCPLSPCSRVDLLRVVIFRGADLTQRHPHLFVGAVPGHIHPGKTHRPYHRKQEILLIQRQINTHPRHQPVHADG